MLVLADGTRRVVARLPEALRGRTGARVWLAGPLDGDIDSFGVISDPLRAAPDPQPPRALGGRTTRSAPE